MGKEAPKVLGKVDQAIVDLSVEHGLGFDTVKSIVLGWEKFLAEQMSLNVSAQGVAVDLNRHAQLARLKAATLPSAKLLNQSERFGSAVMAGKRLECFTDEQGRLGMRTHESIAIVFIGGQVAVMQGHSTS